MQVFFKKVFSKVTPNRGNIRKTIFPFSSSGNVGLRNPYVKEMFEKWQNDP
jgi:hypothetical protein